MTTLFYRGAATPLLGLNPNALRIDEFTNAGLRQASLASGSLSDSGAKVRTVSPVAGLIVALDMTEYSLSHSGGPCTYRQTT